MTEEFKVSLKEYVEALLNEREKALINTANNLEIRLAHLNELRSNVLTRGEYNQAHDSLSARVARIENWQAKLIGIGIALAFLSGILGAVITHLFKS